MKSYKIMSKLATDLEQSEKLSKILKIDSADMVWNVCVDDTKRLLPKNDWDATTDGNRRNIPAWSVDALMAVLPIRFEYEFHVYKFKMCTDVYSNGNKVYDLGYQGAYGWLEFEDSAELVDACVNLIIKLHERELI